MTRRNILFVIITVLGCGGLGVLFGQVAGNGFASDTQIRGSLQQFTEIYNVVEQNYAEQVDPSKAIYDGAIPGMLRVLDPHSTFFDPKQFAQLEESQKGKYYGVGMTIGPRNNHVVVIAPLAGTPAARAGVRPGDIIIAVDGQPTDNMSTDDVVQKVRGPKGTTVHITVMREGSERPLEFALTRDEIRTYSVDVHFMIRPGIGYMHISSFDETTVRETQDALNQFGNLQGLILDLRQDPGGLLGAAVGVAGKFLPKGDVVVSQAGRASPEQVYRASQGDNGKDYPIVILVDRGTASGAEIVAGALQDHDRGLVAGENTFGKGLVQTVFQLSDNTGLALTTAKYYTPSGRLIQRNYTGVDLYDYYYGRENSNNANRQVKYTDSGRPVYGGDGITPDVKLANRKHNAFQDYLLAHFAFPNFAQDYLTRHQITKNVAVDDQMLQDFRNYLNQHQIAFTEEQLSQNLDWVKAGIKTELVTDAFGLDQGQVTKVETDPEVAEALNLLPQAKQLEQHAQQVIAERRAAAIPERKR
ncbi:MAG TPA: S41 family peptidase [Terriglobales bacterium]|nr:S41 family peptidase [Terriglobales bacterium]